MCRLVVYRSSDRMLLLASLLTHPQHSIIHQSMHSELRMTSPLNGDGFGVGWYASDDTDGEGEAVMRPCVFTDITPAWNNRNLHQFAGSISSKLIFAHVRAASPNSPISQTNCHPFQFKQFMWMHNGDLPAFSKFKLRLLNDLHEELFAVLEGHTDSEHCFLVFLNTLIKHNGGPFEATQVFSPDVIRKCMEDTIEQLLIYDDHSDRFSLINFVVSDGRTVCATRFVNHPTQKPASLFYASGSHWDRTEANDNGSYRMQTDDLRQKCHIIASEPLTRDKRDWVEIERNSLVLLTPESDLLIYPLKFENFPF